MRETEGAFQRSRPLYAFLAALVIGTGLLWRSHLVPLPDFLVKYGGDSLWALLVFLVFGFIFTRRSTWRVVFMAFCFAWSIEFLQLYHAEWIDSIRSTRIGHLILGSTFNSPDLLAYLLGIAFGGFAERAYFKTDRGIKAKA
jgi:hypothetical protein